MKVPSITTMAADVDLSGSWDDFYNAIGGDGGIARPILSLMAIIGVLLVVIAIVKWAWDRRRGGGMGNSGGVWGALLVGCLLAAPSVIIPIFLTVLDILANGAISVYEKSN